MLSKFLLMETFLDGKCLLPVTSGLLEALTLRGMENSCASIACDEPLGSELMLLLTGEGGKGGRKERGDIKPLKTSQTKVWGIRPGYSAASVWEALGP